MALAGVGDRVKGYTLDQAVERYNYLVSAGVKDTEYSLLKNWLNEAEQWGAVNIGSNGASITTGGQQFSGTKLGDVGDSFTVLRDERLRLTEAGTFQPVGTTSGTQTTGGTATSGTQPTGGNIGQLFPGPLQQDPIAPTFDQLQQTINQIMGAGALPPLNNQLGQNQTPFTPSNDVRDTINQLLPLVVGRTGDANFLSQLGIDLLGEARQFFGDEAERRNQALLGLQQVTSPALQQLLSLATATPQGLTPIERTAANERFERAFEGAEADIGRRLQQLGAVGGQDLPGAAGQIAALLRPLQQERFAFETGLNELDAQLARQQRTENLQTALNAANIFTQQGAIAANAFDPARLGGLLSSFAGLPLEGFQAGTGALGVASDLISGRENFDQNLALMSLIGSLVSSAPDLISVLGDIFGGGGGKPLLPTATGVAGGVADAIGGLGSTALSGIAFGAPTLGALIGSNFLRDVTWPVDTSNPDYMNFANLYNQQTGRTLSGFTIDPNSPYRLS